MQMRTLAPGGCKPLYITHLGFTLLELLVVLVILAITAALTSAKLFPDEARLLRQDAHRFAEILSAAQDQAQISGDAYIMQTHENGFRIVHAQNASSTVRPNKTLSNLLKPRTWQHPPIRVQFFIDGIPQRSLLLPPQAHMKVTVIELERNQSQVRIIRTALGRFKIAP